MIRCFLLSLLFLALSIASSATADDKLKKLPPDLAARLVSINETPSPSGPDSGVIEQHHDNGQIKIQRQVIRDLADLPINHGMWKKFSPHGTLLVEGQYRDGLRHGVWNAWYEARDAALFDQQPFRQFDGPFISQATFVDGKLEGTWTIYDSKHRKISRWHYSAGERHGLWQWWSPSGHKVQELTYHNGVADGVLKQFDAAGKVASSVRLEDGRRLDEKIERYESGGVKSKTSYLLARRVPVGKDDWLSLRLVTYKSEGSDTKHGPDESWYANGKPRQRAMFDHGIKAGEFVWWHKNGQMSLRGTYVDGRREGQWTWWHANGQTSIEGYFASGKPVERWVYWNDNGRVSREAEFTRNSGVVTRQNKQDKTAQRPNDTGVDRDSMWY